MTVGRLMTRVRQPLMDDGGAAGAGTGAGSGDGGEKDLISRAEAQKAFKDRDAAKAKARELEARLKELEGLQLSETERQELQERRERESQLEEERAKKAGEYETLKSQLTERQKQLQAEHQKMLQEREQKYSQLSERFKHTVIRAEFGAATDYFGGSESSRTILDVDLGMAALGKFVHVEDVEDDALGYRVVVKKPNGEVIFGADGNPAPFAEAIGELIKALPNRDRILRGSGKTGSGSSGGSTGSHQPVDLRNLTAAQLRDPKVLAELKRLGGSSGIQMGTAFTK